MSNIYRKRPVLIQAELVTGDNAEFLREWSNGEVKPISCVGKDDQPIIGAVKIDTLEGMMIGKPGDWIIKGVKGEFYPCKPDIFDATYEPAGRDGLKYIDQLEQTARDRHAAGEVHETSQQR